MDRQYSFPKNEDNNGEHEEREGDEKGNIRDMFGTRPGPGGPATSSTSDAGNTGNTGIGRIPILSSPIPAVNPLLEASSRSSWLPILENSNQLVLYNPTSHALTITPSSLPPVPISFPRSNVNTSSAMVPTRKMLRSQSHPEESLRNHGHDLDLALGVGHTQNHGPGHLTTSDATREVVLCPMCTRPLPPGFGIGRMRPPGHGHGHGNGSGIGLGLGLAHGLESSSSFGGRHGFSRRAPNYFQLLEEANFEAQSRPASPPLPAISPLSPDVPTIESIESIDPSLESLASFASTSTTTSVLRHGHGHGHGQERTQIKPDALGRIRNRLQVADGSTVKGGGNLGGGGVSMDSRPRAGTGTGAEAEAEVEEGGATAPTIVDNDSVPGTPKPRFGANSMAQGYFAAFFREEKRLGMGANGSVYLCQHVLDGNYLGHFAVKKIAVGHSHEYLLRILKEVRLLETLRHPNIVSYHHSWLETTKFSSFGPSIPTLHVLMEWAECGSLDDLIDQRQGKRHPPTSNTPGLMDDEDESTKSARIRAFKAAKQNQAAGGSNARSRKTSVGASAGVHLLSVDEIKSFFSDIVSGLAFLHDRSILHLDLKLGNVLLTKDDDRIIARAMLSDFGTSQDALQGPRVRSGNTGTVEYSAPEALQRDQNGSLLQIDSKSDMWSLGMILHKLIFFRLPYPDIDPIDTDGIEREVLAYPGWKPNVDVLAACKRRGLPRAILLLLESLLNRNPRERPTSERVLHAFREGTLEPNGRISKGETSIVARRRSISDEKARSTSPPSGLALQKLSEPPSPVVFFEENNTPPDPISSLPSATHTRKRTPTPPLIQEKEDETLHSTPRPAVAFRSSFSVSLHLNTLVKKLAKLLIRKRLRPYVRILQTQARWRTLRLGLLILKIISMSSVCRPAHVVHWMQALIVGIAVMDVWYEGEGGVGAAGDSQRHETEGGDITMPVVTLLLGIAHLVLLSVVRWRQESLCVL